MNKRLTSESFETSSPSKSQDTSDQSITKPSQKTLNINDIYKVNKNINKFKTDSEIEEDVISEQTSTISDSSKDLHEL